MRKIRKTPVLADSYQIPRYKYTEKDEEYYDIPDEYGMKKADYSPVYRTKTNTIEVPKRSWSKNDVHLVIKDTDGHEILKDGWYSSAFVNEISRSLPHWGFKDVQRTKGDPNVWIVEKDTDDYITVNRRPVESSLDLFGIDDAFFTKEELLEFANAVEEDVNEKFKSFNSDFSIKYSGIWLEDDNRTITMDYICFPNENEYSVSVRVDMRAIKAPGDIFKYVEPMANKIDEEIKSSEVIGSTCVEAGDEYVGNILPVGDEDGYYLVTAYADDRYRGRIDDFTSNSFDDIILKANEYCNSGFNIEIENMGSGEGKRYSSTEWLECIEQTGEPPYSVYDLSDGNIEGATNLDSRYDRIKFTDSEGNVDYLPTWYLDRSDEEIEEAKNTLTNSPGKFAKVHETKAVPDINNIIKQLKHAGYTRNEIDSILYDLECGRTLDSAMQRFAIDSATDIGCASNIDALERIAHDTFNDVLSGRGRDQVTDDIILEVALKYDPNLSEADKEKVIDLTNEQIDSYFNIGSFGQVQAEKYGDKIFQAYEGKTISKRRDKVNDPDGLTKCANAIGLGTFQLLEALEGMCADGRAREIDDSTYYIGQ